MLLIGLTGSIATGKSTVSSILRALPYSLPIIDADVIARQVVEPGTPAYAKIVQHFAATTPDLLLPAAASSSSSSSSSPTSQNAANTPSEPGPGNQPLNRPALGRRVFGDSEDRKRDRGVLNGIVHPAVRMEMYKQLLRCYVKGHWAVVLDVPLLFESGLDVLCGVVLVVAVTDPAIQMSRLRARDVYLTEEDAKNRVLSQGDVKEKARRCEARGQGRGVVLWNNGDREGLKGGISMAMESVRMGSPGWWGWLLLLVPPMAGLAGLWTYWRNLRINKRWRDQQLLDKAKL